MRRLAAVPFALLAACTRPPPSTDVSVDATDAIDSLDASDVLPPLPDVADPDGAPTPALHLRRTLGIPDEARRVLVIGQNAHLDLNWTRTTESYYTGYVEQIYSNALDAIANDPEYHYATAEMAFLRMFWERRPERHDALIRAIQQGQFQIVGGGVSQPDTLIPMGENLIRDYLSGDRWLHSIGATRTRAAYLPDSFGLSGTTPDVLHAAGFDSVAFWRVDGTSDVPEFNASVADFANLPVTPGTNAASLRAASIVDFIWEGAGGAQVLGHWLTNGYMFGDYIDFVNITYRQYGDPVGRHLTNLDLIDNNIQGMVDIMAPQSPTDYMFVPVGGDFVYPKPLLAHYAQYWNRTRYPSTGVWVRAGTFAEFSDLALTQRERLPVRRLDAVPYWMGFYASRPVLKDLARRTSCTLDMAHRAFALDRTQGLAGDSSVLDAPEWTASMTDHHDWVTGTSVDEVMYGDQLPHSQQALAQSESALGVALQRMADSAPNRGASVTVFNADGAVRDGLATAPFMAPAGTSGVRAYALDDNTEVPAQWNSDGTSVVLLAHAVPSVGYRSWRLAPQSAVAPGAPTILCTDATSATVACNSVSVANIDVQATSVHVVVDVTHGAALRTLEIDGTPTFAAPGAQLIVFDDTGGLYTFANEDGHAFSQSYVVGAEAAMMHATIAENGPARTVLHFEFLARSIPYVVEYTIPAQGRFVDATVTTRAAPGTSLLARFPTLYANAEATMAAPGGILTRPAVGRLSPTFSAFEQWFACDDRAGTGGLTLSAIANPAVSFDTHGTVDLVLHRNPPAPPPGGIGGTNTTNDPATLHVRLAPYVGHRTHREHYAATVDMFYPLEGRVSSVVGTGAPAASFMRVDGDAVLTAVRAPSDGGTGFVVRLLRTETASTPRVITSAPGLTTIELIDAMEQNPVPLAGSPADFTLPTGDAITTVRLR